MSDDETVILNEFRKTSSLNEADKEIISNLTIQFCLFIGLVSCYLFLRPRIKWLYSPNILNKPNHPCFGYNGFFNWIVPIYTITDSKLLALIGLDAFMMLQTLKFIYRIFAFLCFTFLPILSYIYWHYPNDIKIIKNQFISRISIGNIKTDSVYYFMVPIALYIISFLIFYFLFIYYKRYTVLRQLFLRNPSTMTSIITLKRLAKQLETSEKATEFLSLSNRTILASNLPKFVKTSEDLKNFFVRMGVGEIDDTVLLHDTTKLRNLISEKDDIIECVEKEINNVFYKMNMQSKYESENCKESFGIWDEYLMKTVEEYKNQEKFDLSTKIHIFKTFIKTNDNYKTLLKNNVKVLDFYFDSLKILYQKIKEEKERLKVENVIMESPTSEEIEEQAHALFIPGDIDRDASFFGLYHFLHFKKYRDYFSINLPFGSRKGFVVFKSFKDASIVKQAKLGSKIFSVKAQNAPNPNDVIWDNITKGGVTVFLFSTWGNIIFFIFNLLFTYIVVNVAQMVDLENFDKNGRIMQFFSKYPTIKAIYTGNIPSIVYSLILLFVPMIITTLVNLEGIYSYSKSQQITMSKYLNFLFFNGFVSMFFAKTLYNSLKELIFRNVKLEIFMKRLGSKILDSVVFFANTTIQKALFGTAMLLLKPAPLIVNYFLINIFPLKTRRQKEQSEFAPPFDFGGVFPEVLICFPMVLVYSVICPLVLIPGLFYFSFAYFIYKSEFLYASINKYESGGKYWEKATEMIIYSLLVFQLATACMMYTHDRKKLAVTVIPLSYITWIYRKALENIFEKSCNCYPLNIQEENYLDEFTTKLEKERIKMLAEWEEFEPIKDEDIIGFDDLGYEEEKFTKPSSYYNDPTTSNEFSYFMLPKHFFKLLFFIKNKDKNNIFGYKNSNI